MNNITNIFNKNLSFTSNQYAIINDKKVNVEFKSFKEINNYVNTFLIKNSYFPNDLNLTIMVKRYIFRQAVREDIINKNEKLYLNHGITIWTTQNKENMYPFAYTIKLLD